MTSAAYRATLSSPRLHLVLPTATKTDNDFQDMMADSTTPPLDLASDSGEEDEYDDDNHSITMHSPVSPPAFQPTSILLNRKRKDSQVEHSSVLRLFERQRDQHEPEYAALPALQGYGKGGRGRRPTVTFDLDEDEALSQQQHTNPLSVHRLNHRHNDVEALEAIDGVNLESSLKMSDLNEDKSLTEIVGTDVSDSIAAAEHALRRVSITPPIDPISERASSPTMTTVTTTESPAISTSPASTTTLPTTSALENSAPQEIAPDHTADTTIVVAPLDMLVALLDRPSELETLVTIHSDFFSLIYSSLSKSSRKPLKTLLFTPRSSLGDRDWMQALVDNYLGALPPCILEKFKGIVGWIGPDGDEDNDENHLWGEDEYCCRDSSFEHIQIKWFRDVPDFPLEVFEQCYPQFFVNARKCLEGRRMSIGGDQRDHYVIFRETLGLTRDDLPCDNAWTRRMNGCLEKHPELLLQLKEIVAYETGYDY
ncbi:hypothetical protein FBU30_005194 [Linnemannia zychae]|nr:hypothetical protein FBU30_005194 [Linnemannia zychae]